ncbi:UvrD-helicase domain-containing protein [Acinetobacter sp. 99]|uniref:UvrD-helicase domain-containing protein n=1 Tax=Acinetobacter TaxID=469 RepID=UPI00300A70B4
MSQAIEITDEDIRYAENILLPQGKTFDDERRNFIRNLSTIDLQAVPGSGKTTALLAKLLILETKLPLSDGSGILVLSHTNAAMDEIKERIHQYCPKLFRYPHFIGTIQSFVNEFLAIPYYLFKLKKKPLRIDNEIYAEQIEFALSYNTKIALSKRGINYIDILSNSFISNKEIFQHFWSNNEVTIPNIGSHTNTYKELATIKINLLKTGILSFGDCYALAQKYLNNYPIIHKIINKRFKYVFIDEMQDMDTHQYELVEKIFTENNDTNTIIQRIGDKNQSIYNSIKAESIWQDRDNVLHLSNSQRLSKPIANIVKNFALYPEYCTDIQGMSECQLKPHILLFSDSSIQSVISHFSELVQQYINSGELNTHQDKPPQIKVISWNTDWKDDEKSRNNPKKVRLEDYHPIFKKNEQKIKEEYKCLKSYIYFYDKKSTTLSAIRKNIFHALIKIIRIEKIANNENRLYTIKNLLSYLKENSPENHENLNLKIYQFSLKIIKNEKDQALSDLKAYIPTFISYFKENHRLSSKCSDFINTDKTSINPNHQNNPSTSNMIEENTLKIDITSVHSVKGQTHDATLYLESYYYEDGKGNNAKSYESQRLANQFLGNSFNLTTERAKQSTKMAYVGFSRATQLLCIAIHKDRFEQYLNTIDRNIWEVKNIE